MEIFEIVENVNEAAGSRERRVPKSNSGSEFKEIDFNLELLEPIAEYLESNKGLHIHEVYFSRDGQYYFNVHEFKGKLYSRIEIVTVNNPNGAGKMRKLVNYEGREIIVTMTADEIIDKVQELKNERNADTVDNVDKIKKQIKKTTTKK